MSETLRKTPLYERHERHGARFVPFAGFEMPVQYTGVVAEHQAVRSALGLFDVSHMGELFVEGDGALDAVNRLITNDLLRVPNGKALYTCCCKEDGGILDDLIVYRLSDRSVMVVCNASNREKIVGHFRRELGESVDDRSDTTALIAVQGPTAWACLERIVGESLELGRFRTRELTLLGHHCRIGRTGYTGEDGFELFCANTSAEAVWDALLNHGRELGAVPVGLAARDTLRLEAKLALYGNDIDESTNPLEAGLSWTVKLDKPDFIGKRALLAAREAPKARTLVGFEMTGRGIARHDYPVLEPSGARIGVCTSGAPSPTLGKNIGLAYVPPEYSEIGASIAVDCRGRVVSAQVVATPFYKKV